MRCFQRKINITVNTTIHVKTTESWRGWMWGACSFLWVIVYVCVRLVGICLFACVYVHVFVFVCAWDREYEMVHVKITERGCVWVRWIFVSARICVRLSWCVYICAVCVCVCACEEGRETKEGKSAMFIIKTSLRVIRVLIRKTVFYMMMNGYPGFIRKIPSFNCRRITIVPQ